MDNLLQRFLDAGFLKGIDGNEQFGHLGKAAQDLIGKPQKTRADLIPFTLIALDPEVSENEPLLDKVEVAIKKHWPTFRNRFASRPVQVFRAVIFEALRLKTAKDDVGAAIVWLTGASYFQNKTYAQDEASILKEFLFELGNRMEKQSEEHWLVNSKSLKQDQSDSLSIPDVNQGVLAARLLMAAGPQDKEGNPVKNANPNWPNTNLSWATEFSRIGAWAVSTIVNDNNAQVRTALTDFLASFVASTQEALSTLNRRYDLLWWRHTLYSPTLKSTYRGLDSSTLCLLTSFDVYKMVPELYPQSVEFLLRETVNTLLALGNTETKVTLLNFLQSLASTAHLKELRDNYKATASENANRASLLDLIKDVLSDQLPSSALIKTRMGVSSELSIEISELTVWVLRSLQAQHLAEQRIKPNG